ncbi:hypothetical protein CALCODRAFT_555661 [Calocera cornea HHB12733]|uniref:Senescence domain-containing protein n=1 Tax=Calocera cornea HHB12733 TaxID=1353952 RepID=A0A165FMQ4_9BASI|nr:hypothetical protein CALCODRAFT_555661 [Calocera cornea HHB12733]
MTRSPSPSPPPPPPLPQRPPPPPALDKTREENVNIQPEQFLLLAFPSALVSLPPADPADRAVELLCVTYPAPAALPSAPGSAPQAPQTDTDTLLLLRLGPPAAPPPAAHPPPGDTHVIPLFPSQPILHAPHTRTFHFPSAEPALSITFPRSEAAPEWTDQEQSDVETLELLLRDYGVLHPPHHRALSPSSPLSLAQAAPPAYALPDDPRGRLLVVDEDSGAVLGELEHPALDLAAVSESPSLTQQAHEKDPVVIQLPPTPPEGEAPAETLVRPAETEEEFELILRGATVLSRAIQGATSAITGGINYAAQLYVAHVPPAPGGPTHLSPGAQAAVRSVHQVSGTAVRVTAKTTGVVHRFIERAIDKAGEAAQGLRGPQDPNAPPPPNTPWREATRKGGALLSRVLVGTDMLLTTVETSTQALVNSTTEGVSHVLEHRYGPEVGSASRTVSETVRNVGVVYVDARGVGHRALLKSVGKRAVQVTMMSGGKVSLGQAVVKPGEGPIEVLHGAMRETERLDEALAHRQGSASRRRQLERDAVAGTSGAKLVDRRQAGEGEGSTLRRRDPWEQEQGEEHQLTGPPGYDHALGYSVDKPAARDGKLIDIDTLD